MDINYTPFSAREYPVSLIRKSKRAFRRDEEGATAVEYAVMISLIAAVVIVGVGQVSEAMRENYNHTGQQISEAMGK